VSELWQRTWRVAVASFESEDLDITFKVTRTLRATAGTCDLKVYGLTAAHRHEAQSTRRALVRVSAGHVATGTPLLFQGNVHTAATEREGPDWISHLVAGDGIYAVAQARAARSFGPDARVEEVARYLAGAMGVGLGNVLPALRTARLDRLGDTFPQGTTAHGYAATELTSLLAASGLTWSIQGGVLQVLPRGQALQRQAVRLSGDTGLVGSPALGQHGVVKVKALLQPDLVPGQLVQVDSLVLAGTYRVEKAEYTGDTRGNDWYAALDVRRVAVTAT
jgi:hypothetical protein